MAKCKPDYGKVRETVRQVLEENYIVGPPVRVDVLIDRYGLSVCTMEFPSKFSHVAGYIDFDEQTVVANAADSAQRRGFTLAHELGHWLLHRDELAQNRDIAVLYRTPLGETNHDPLELEANAFAANLLVPKDFLRLYRDLDRATVARIFGVSQEVIGYRLANYGF